MGVSFGRARIADLAFHVFHRSLHPEWFSTRVHHRVGLGEWRADVRIIEGGHAVVFGSHAFRLTEILAGPETPLPEPGLLYHSPIRNEKSTTLRPGGLLNYQACFEIERTDPELFRHICEEMTADARDGLFYRFGASNRLSPQPISRIHIDARAKGLSIQAFHSFPDELAIVRSLSLYELPTPSK